VCSSEITQSGYQHFCQHFRAGITSTLFRHG
jgi:hypothetical protein